TAAISGIIRQTILDKTKTAELPPESQKFLKSINAQSLPQVLKQIASGAASGAASTLLGGAGETAVDMGFAIIKALAGAIVKGR
ncbi:MAG: hypothetical protein LBG76_00515, partial [Treponema sp.]|nr:hypothetical protein [Treponema sp.]